MTEIVGIVNVTPDSFSDGGSAFSPEAALRAIEKMIDEGVHVIDIGAESTRPGATPLSPEEEWSRLLPVLQGLAQMKKTETSFSLDTRHASTVRNAVAFGIGWINDVSGFTDTAMIEAAAASRCRLVVMHSLSVPADKTVVLPEETDVMKELIEFADARFAALHAAGVARERVIFDPGIGFGKTAAQSIAILERIRELESLDVPILVGHSRKSFLSVYAQGVDRDAATIDVSKALIASGVDYLRVHDVASHMRLSGVCKGEAHG